MRKNAAIIHAKTMPPKNIVKNNHFVQCLRVPAKGKLEPIAASFLGLA